MSLLFILMHAGDLAFNPADAQAFTVIEQDLGIEAGVEVISVRKARQLGAGYSVHRCKTMLLSGLSIQRVMPIILGHISLSGLVPVVKKTGNAQLATHGSKGVHIAFAGLMPVFKFYPQLYHALGVFEKMGLINAKHLVKGSDRRDGGLADTHGTDSVGLYQLYMQLLAEKSCQHGGCHPARRAAAHNQYTVYRLFGHSFSNHRFSSQKKTPATGFDYSRGLLTYSLRSGNSRPTGSWRQSFGKR